MSLTLAIQQVMLPPNYGPLYAKEISKDNGGMTQHRRDHANNFQKVFAELRVESTLDAMLEVYREAGNRVDRTLARKICEQMVEEGILKRRKATTGGRPRVFYSPKVKP